MSVLIYNQSKILAEKQQNIVDVLNWTSKTTKLEVGPLSSLEDALTHTKPDIFIPLQNKVVKQICPEDPKAWWVVTTTPVCFGWKNGYCKNVTVSKNGKVHNHCNFRHEHNPYIKVEIVPTEKMLKKMKNRTKKLRENGTKNKKNMYSNPFTGIWYPCNYKKSITKPKPTKNERETFVENQKQMVKEFKNFNIRSFSNKTSFVTKWVIQQRRPLVFEEELERTFFERMLELGEESTPIPTLVDSPFSSLSGKSWASICEEEDEIDRLEKERVINEDDDDEWTTVTRK